MRYLVFALAMLLGPVLSARAQFSVDIGIPGLNIGINMPVYPHLVRIPGYPVYYDPDVNSNYFFYDGLYWIYVGDNWYSSTWYNGPWELVEPEYVPQFLLLVPVRYYRAPPVYFRSWSRDGPPRWGEHWGRSWEQRRSGWDRWDRRSAPAAAPLPIYQRQYSGDRYPRAIAQQQTLRSQNYRYQPRDTLAKRTFERATQGHQAQPQAQPQRSSAEGTPRLRTQTQQQPAQQGSLPQTEQRRPNGPAATTATAGQPQRPQADAGATGASGAPCAPSGAKPSGQNGPQERAHVERGSPQGKGPAPKSAPRETRAAPQASGPQGGGGQNRAAPQNRGPEKAAPQEAKGGQQGKGNEKGARGGQVKADENKKE